MKAANLVRGPYLVPLSAVQEEMLARHTDKFGHWYQHIDPATIPAYVKALYERKQAIQSQAAGTQPPRKPPAKILTAAAPDPQGGRLSILFAVDFRTILVALVIGIALLVPVAVYAVIH